MQTVLHSRRSHLKTPPQHFVSHVFHLQSLEKFNQIEFPISSSLTKEFPPNYVVSFAGRVQKQHPHHVWDALEGVNFPQMTEVSIRKSVTVFQTMAEVLLRPLKQIPYFDWELFFLPLPQCGPAKQGPAVQACDYISSPPTACP